MGNVVVLGIIHHETGTQIGPFDRMDDHVLADKSEQANSYQSVGAYQYGTWVVGVVKTGVEERRGPAFRQPLHGGALRRNRRLRARPRATSRRWRACDLDLCKSFKETTFNFDVHRQPEAYRRIAEREGPRLMADGTPAGQAAGKSSS